MLLMLLALQSVLAPHRDSTLDADRAADSFSLVTPPGAPAAGGRYRLVAEREATALRGVWAPCAEQTPDAEQVRVRFGQA
ncbi:hypothetical protein AB2M62_15750 [Sphingomonas sp. MMS12-HWE2-04]|uniref:hypothetical protein n=1 Tax=Sphingomonas sp. MMS12-HWE2-04 TaxID=3234199 RepID=UPI00384D615D